MQNLQSENFVCYEELIFRRSGCINTWQCVTGTYLWSYSVGVLSIPPWKLSLLQCKAGTVSSVRSVVSTDSSDSSANIETSASSDNSISSASSDSSESIVSGDRSDSNDSIK